VKHGRNTHPALAAAIDATSKRKGPPTEADIPPTRPAEGRAPLILPGQLDLEGNEYRPGPRRQAGAD
jgi:hypothetical protein